MLNITLDLDDPGTAFTPNERVLIFLLNRIQTLIYKLDDWGLTETQKTKVSLQLKSIYADMVPLIRSL